jgi:hypothetical protein
MHGGAKGDRRSCSYAEVTVCSAVEWPCVARRSNDHVCMSCSGSLCPVCRGANRTW